MIKEMNESSHVIDLFNEVAAIVKATFNKPSVSIYDGSGYKCLSITIFGEEFKTYRFEFPGTMTEEEREAKIKEIEDFRDSIRNEYRFITWETHNDTDGTEVMTPVKFSKTEEDANEVLREISEELNSPIKYIRGTEFGDFPAVWAYYVQTEFAKYYTTYESPYNDFGID